MELFENAFFKPEKFENATELCVLVLERRHFANVALFLHITHLSVTKMEFFVNALQTGGI